MNLIIFSFRSRNRIRITKRKDHNIGTRNDVTDTTVWSKDLFKWGQRIAH